MLYYLILSIVIVLLIMALLASLKSRRPIVHRQMIKLSNADFDRVIIPFSRNLRISERGKGMNIHSLYPKIARAYRQICTKVKEGSPLFEYERWFYENLYLAKRFLFSHKRMCFKNLPHVNGQVRIVELARKIVDNSLLSLSNDRIAAAMNSIKNEVSLCFSEVMELKDALGFALLEQIYILAERIIFHNKQKNLAERYKINKKRLKSDVYCYFAMKSPSFDSSALRVLQAVGINTQAVTMNYNLSLLESTQMAESLFTSLMSLGSCVQSEQCLEFLNTESYLNRDEIYSFMNLSTKMSYHHAIADIAESCNVSEVLVCTKLMELSRVNTIDVGVLLYDYKKMIKKAVKCGKNLKIEPKQGSRRELAYIFSIALLSIGVSIGLYFLHGSILAVFLGLLPVFMASDYIVNAIISELVKNRPLPQMNYSEIPAECRTLVVVSEFITDPEQADEAIEHLKALRESNCDKNIDFSLLVDFKGGESAVQAGDAAILSRFEVLRQQEGYNVFIRKRVKEGKKYVAYERKRGAIMALCRYLLSGDDGEFSYILNKEMPKPVFLVPLDADNTVVAGTIREMVNTISHPYNAKYDLINAHSRYNLFSMKTAYGLRFLGEAGQSGYPVFSTYFYNLFGKDIFCGKGVFRLKSFFNKLDGILPSQKILSHDILEGAILNTGCGGTVFEDTPKSFLADRARRKRWQRGDIQLLPFVGRSWRNENGEKYRSPITPFYKYLMIKNAISVINPLLLLILSVVGIFSSVSLVAFAAAMLVSPFLVNQIKIFRGFLGNIRLRYVVKKSFFNFTYAIEEILLLPYYALSNAELFLSTLCRMATKKNLLEWKTYRQVQKKSSLAAYIAEFFLGMIFVSLLSILAFFTVAPIFTACFALLCCLIIFVEFASSGELKEGKVESFEREILMEYAQSTYRYFCFMDEERGIISDNFQFKPYKGRAENTSPTNIGYSLLADICAFLLGIIDFDAALSKLTKKMNAIEGLEKWNGNLYNWYNVEALSVVNRFVSSVDSGNFLACLIVTAEFLRENGATELAYKVDKLIKNTDLSALYDERTKLFYLGYDGDAGEYTGHYDILASESRLLSLIFVSGNGKVEHWRNLQRDYVSLMGNTLLSWSGTAFEYLMSDLFFVPPKYSLLGKTSKNVSKIQSQTLFRELWGVSESAYYDFDENLRYQYRAFGLSKLSLRSEYDKAVVSPYSSILALRYRKKQVLDNLRRINKFGGYGEYGFLEAVDCSGKIRFVGSYMTHHQGMIMAAITNLLTGDGVCRLFEKTPRIRGGLNLLNEMPSETVCRQIDRKTALKYIESNSNYYKNYLNLELSPVAAALTNGVMSVVCDNLGNGFLRYGSIFLNVFRCRYNDYNGNYFYLIEEDSLHSAAYYPMCKKKENHTFAYSSSEISLTNTEKHLKQDICVADGINAVIYKFSLDKKSQVKDASVGFYMPLAINTLDGYVSHPVFSNMFIQTEYDANMNTIIAQKRSSDKEGDIFVAAVIRGLTDMKIQTNRFNFLGRNGSERSPAFFSGAETVHPSLGDVLEPCFGFTGKFESEEERSCQVIILAAKTKEELYASIRFLPDDCYSFARESSRNKIRISEKANELLGDLLYTPYSNVLLTRVLKNNTYKEFMEFSGGLKTLLYVYNPEKNEAFGRLLSSVKELQFLDVSTKLIVLYEENFNDTQRKHILSQIKLNFIRNYVVCDKNDIQGYAYDYAFIILDWDLKCNKPKYRDDFSYIYRKNEANDNKNLPTGSSGIPQHDFSVDYSSGTGYFSEQSYVVSHQPLLPYSNVVCGKHGGFIMTENGGGLIYFQNSRENKVSRFDFDPVKDLPSELILAVKDGKYIKLNGSKTQKTVFSKGLVSHYTNFDGISFIVKHYIIDEGAAKIAEACLGENTPLSLIYALEPCLSWKCDNTFISVEAEENMIKMTNLMNGSKAFCRVVFENQPCEIAYGVNDVYPHFDIAVPQGYYGKILIVLSDDYEYVKNLNFLQIEEKKNVSIADFESVSNISIASPEKGMDYLASLLPYQVYSSRLNGKCGYYQAGGAVGFRDQLQDCMALLQSRPELARRQIIESARHQYEEGDVMHWWHHPNWGLRTKISDDKLYLPYVTAVYVEATGDRRILDEEHPYLKSDVLLENQHTRFENPPHTEYNESIKRHCLKAIKSALRYGEHNLLLLGGGDWNDGLDYAGIKGTGESVMLTMFCYEVINKFAVLCDAEQREKLLNIAKELKKAVNNHCYDGNRFSRIYTDGGKWLGTKSTPEYEIDIVAQSYAVLSEITDETRQQAALDSAKQLVDEENGIIKLLSPPLDKKTYLGYISAYPKGVRENGGQYTHAAVWYLIALARVGRQDESYELFKLINPVEKCKDASGNRRYMGEPYVLAGDVYSNTDNPGRMGWSWYTGSAAWAYRLIVEEYYGLRRRGDILLIAPKLPKKLINSQLEYRFRNSTYKIYYKKGNADRVILNGVVCHKPAIKLEEGKLSEVVVEVKTE